MSKLADNIEARILKLIDTNPGLSSSEIHVLLKSKQELISTKRRLSKLIESGLITTSGTGKSTRYHLDSSFKLFSPLDAEKYFKQEIDKREITNHFNHDLIQHVLPKVKLFTEIELKNLNDIQKKYLKNVSKIPVSIYNQELERLAIDLSWKSSQIEGNTYSLLETELLLKEKKEAKGKKRDEADMLLNHKYALDFIIDEPDYVYPLTVSKIENIHKLLVKNLGIDPNIRKRLVGITGTNYKPLDNQFQIKEALQEMCRIVNNRKNVFEKALLTLLLISYIQPFADGNKRSARIISNAILIHFKFCPLSFRTVDSLDYKKAMLLFYEQNNLNAFKRIFIEQYEFAVKTYFA